MQQIINFIIRNKISLFYIFLMLIAMSFTIQSHSYHQSKFFNSANRLTGGIYNTSTNITSYFDLKSQNKNLLEENLRLRASLYNTTKKATNIDSVITSNYNVIPASIIKNSYASPRNYLTLNIGKNNGAAQDMGVITSKGILGIIESTSEKYSTVQSVLNTHSTINAKIKNTNYFGSLIWDTNHFNIVQLTDVPRLVQLKIGDTIVTGAMSSIFPEDIPIGIIKEYNLNTSKSFYNIDVQLFNDMTNVNTAYVIENKNRLEVLQLQTDTENE